jgi:hypothetical protein
MSRPVAMRAGAIFLFFAAAFALAGLASGEALAQAFFLVSGSVCALMLFFGLTAPAPALVPVRVRTRRSR